MKIFPIGRIGEVGLVPAERLLEYRWSSLVRFVGKERPKVLEAGTLLRESGGLADTPAGWKRYVQYLGVLAEEDTKRREEKFGWLSRGWAIGTEDFQDRLRQDYAAMTADGKRFELAGADRIGHQQLRALLWEDILCSLAQRWKISLDRLSPQRSAPEKVKLAAAMKLACSVSNAWLAQRLQMGPPASVSQYVRRFRLSGAASKPDFLRVLSIVKP